MKYLYPAGFAKRLAFFSNEHDEEGIYPFLGYEEPEFKNFLCWEVEIGCHGLKGNEGEYESIYSLTAFIKQGYLKISEDEENFVVPCFGKEILLHPHMNHRMIQMAIHLLQEEDCNLSDHDYILLDGVWITDELRPLSLESSFLIEYKEGVRLFVSFKKMFPTFELEYQYSTIYEGEDKGLAQSIFNNLVIAARNMRVCDEEMGEPPILR